MTRADKLKPKDVLRVKGIVWTVVKAKVRGKRVRLTVTGYPGTFTDDVKAKQDYKVIPPEKRAKKGKADKGWYKGPQAAEPDPVRKMSPPKKPDWEADKRGWADKNKVDAVVAAGLGGKLEAIQTETDGPYALPMMDSATLPAHLMIYHGVTVDGVSLKEARAIFPDAERTMDVATAMSLAAAQKARDIHDRQHAEFEAGRLALTIAHFHTNERPKL